MKSKRRKQIEGKLGEILLRRVQKNLLRKSPVDAERVGRRIGRILMRVGKRRRERAFANLALAFPEKSDAERADIAERAFEHFGIISADFLQIPRRSLEEFHASTEVVGRENLDKALALNKGVIFITGHFGNWERSSTYISSEGHTLSVVARDTDDAGVNSMVNDLRSFTGTKVISRGAAARPIIAALRRNELVGILPDQNADEIYIPFFGKLAGTVLGPGVIHERTGAPVIPAYCVRIAPGKYRIEVHPALEPLPGYETKGEGMMRAINASLEEIIRKHPEQWLWFHDRWRNARKKGLL